MKPIMDNLCCSLSIVRLFQRKAGGQFFWIQLRFSNLSSPAPSPRISSAKAADVERKQKKREMKNL